MKTILIVIAGMADLPDPLTLRETPLTEAKISSLDILAQRGNFLSFNTIDEEAEISHKNALLSILGYDLKKGEPAVEELMEFGLDNSSPLSQFESLRPFVIPGFSGHGVCVTTSAWARGMAKCALLKPLDIYSPGSSDAEILEAMAELVIKEIKDKEFVFVYVDSPLKASLKGNYETKTKALELIDRHLINPIADFVWKSELIINLAVTTDLVTPWHRRRPSKLSVPCVIYSNVEDFDEEKDTSFTEVSSMLSAFKFHQPSDLIRTLIDYNVPEENHNENDLPF